MLRLRLFGGLALELDGAGVPPPASRRARGLLAWLVLHPGMHPRSQLAGTFWPDVREESARASLRVALTEVRRALGPSASDFLLATRHTVGLAGEGSVWTDVGEFERLLAAGELADAVGLAHGELLAGLDDEWVYEARQGHRDRLGEALAQLAQAAGQRGDDRSAIAWSRRRAELDPLSEDPGRDLIRRLAEGGDHAAAVAAYERLRERLTTALGIAPSPQTRALVARVRAASDQAGEATTGTGPPIVSAQTPPTSLVAQAALEAPSHEAVAGVTGDARLALEDVAHRTGARRVERIGNRVAAEFGSAVDAVDCAVYMQRAGERVARRRSREHAGIRIGLAAGDEGRAEGAIAGELCDHAHDGQIVVSGLVRGLVGARGGRDFRELGTLDIQGVAGPLAVSELRWRAPSVAQQALPAVLSVEEERPFVGRRDSLERLARALEATRGGSGQVAFVAGEPGIGKTRLAARLAGLAHEEGVRVLFGRCFEQAAAPYQPFVEALGPYLHRLEPAHIEAEMGAHVGPLARLFPELASGAAGEAAAAPDPEADRLELFSAIGAAVASASRTAGLLLILEDLHWADRPSLLALRHLLRFLTETPVLVLGTYRESDLETESVLAEVLEDAAREPGFVHLALGPLETGDVERLVAAIAGAERAPAASAPLHAHAEGNPFFVVELLRHLDETGALEKNGPLTETLIARLGVPERVKLVIARRLRRLPLSTQRLLSLAAVAGREFDFDLLEEVSELSADDLADALDEAASAGLVEDDPDRQGRYRFSHALVRDALYEQVGSTRAALLHRRLGEALERLHPGAPGAYVAQLAHHFCEAAAPGDAGKAIEYASRAGEAAIAKLAFEEAVVHYARALRVLDVAEPPDDTRRCELLLALGDAQGSTAEVERWRATFLEAAGLADRLGSAERLARAAVGFGGRYAAVEVGVVNEAVVELLEKAVAALEPGDSPLRAEVTARLAEALAFAPWEARREPLAREALAMARRVGDPLALARVLSRVVWATWSPDNLDERLALTREFTDLAEAGGDRRLAAQGHSWLHTQLLELGRAAEARAEMGWHQREAVGLGDAWRSWISAVYRVNQALFDGRFDEVERLAHEALRIGDQAQNVNAAPMFGAQLVHLRSEQGRLEEVLPGLEQFVERMPLVPSWRAALAGAYGQLGRLDQTRAELEHLAREGFAAIPRDVLWPSTVYGLGEAAGFLRATDHAESIYELLLPYPDRCLVLVVGAYLGPVARLLGRLAAVCGFDEAATQHFERAVDISLRVGSEPWLARTRCEYGEALLRRGGSEASQGRELMAEALATAKRLGMDTLAARARSPQGGSEGGRASFALP